MDQVLNRTEHPPQAASTPGPRLGFLGVGWIGGHRLKSLVHRASARVAAICDPSAQNCREVLELCPEARRVEDLQALLNLGLDGIVIATPSAQHAEQAVQALSSGAAVFCQKPLGLSAAETRAVVGAARQADRLLGVDLSYRYLRDMQRLRAMIAEEAIGRVFAVDLVFHNAYGPDKSWYYDRASAGGGCVMDLGTHLVDILLWMLGYPQVLQVASHLYAAGRPLDGRPLVEDYAAVQMTLQDGISVRLACSWKLQAGREAIIQAAFYGTQGGLCVRNVQGSFFNFQAEWFQGTRREVLSPPSDDWWGAAAVDWYRRLSRDPSFVARAENLIRLAEVLDAIYAAAGSAAAPHPEGGYRP